MRRPIWRVTSEAGTKGPPTEVDDEDHYRALSDQDHRTPQNHHARGTGAGSIGRTDLMGGSFPVLERSIRTQLYSLPEETRVICGHGPETTIGREKATNPFVPG